jgi:glutaredoxin
MSITVFSTRTCPGCHNIKRYLSYKGFKFNEIDVEDKPEARQRIINLTGFMQVPVVQIIKDGKVNFVLGNNLRELSEAL